MKMRREGTGTPHPQSLAATNGSAADLYSNLNEMLDWFELLRRADFDEPGSVSVVWAGAPLIARRGSSSPASKLGVPSAAC